MKSGIAGSAFSLALLLLTTLTVSCGSGNNNRMLPAISISPQIATAQNGQAQFVATGTFVGGGKVTPFVALWTVPPLPHAATSVACTMNGCPSITSQGLASCGSAFTEPLTITASAPVNPKDSLDDFNTPRVSGTATLNGP